MTPVLRIALLVLLLPFAASAQLQLYVAPANGAETPVTGVFDLGQVGVSDTTSVRFRIRNAGATPAQLTALYVAGTGFRMTGAPTTPLPVGAGLNVDFTITFSPANSGSYSANLQVNGTGYILRATGIAAASVRLNGSDLSAGDELDFGRVERGNSARLALQLVNTTSQPVSVASIAASGPAFSLAEGTPPGPVIIPGGGTVLVTLVYSAPVNGISQGTLTVDRRSFRLTGSAYDPPLPRPAIVIESGAIRSGQQGRISVRLEAPARSAAKGQLRMQLRPNGSTADNDGSALFMSGSRTVSFDIAPGDEVVKLRGDTSIVFQAGTTAGTIVFVVEAGGFTEQALVVVAPEPVKLDKATASRTAAGIDVTLSGFDNTRTVKEAAFTFYSNGQPLTGMPVRVPVGSNFESWWRTSFLGGLFQLKAAFPVTGDASKINGFDVAFTSDAGTTTMERIAF